MQRFVRRQRPKLTFLCCLFIWGNEGWSSWQMKCVGCVLLSQNFEWLMWNSPYKVQLSNDFLLILFCSSHSAVSYLSNKAPVLCVSISLCINCPFLSRVCVWIPVQDVEQTYVSFVPLFWLQILLWFMIHSAEVFFINQRLGHSESWDAVHNLQNNPRDLFIYLFIYFWLWVVSAMSPCTLYIKRCILEHPQDF